MANTLDYYDRNAELYSLSTVGCMMDEAIGEFLHQVGRSGLILDFGCGSGRDSKVFLEKGYEVVATDGSENMCREAERYLSRPVVNLRFEDLQDENRFNGIWACASILHLPFDKLRIVIRKMARALTSDGKIYASFRYGEAEGLRGDRYFTDMNEEKLTRLLEDIPLKVVSTWVSKDVRLDRAGDRWFNAILSKA